MRKITILVLLIGMLTACHNSSMNHKPHSEKIDSSYAIYTLGNSVQAFTSKVYKVTKDTQILRIVDSSTIKKIDTTMTIYFIPRLDTAFKHQDKRDTILGINPDGSIKTALVWYPIDSRYILKDLKN